MSILYFEVHPGALLIGMLMIALFVIIQWRRGHNLAYLLCFFLFASYLLVLLDVMFLPIQVPQDWPRNITIQAELFVLSHVNLIPFYFGNLFQMSNITVFWELVGNILLTLPFGFGLPFLINISSKRILPVVCLTGFALETTQLVINLLGLISSHGHSVDINDILLNTSGILLGYWLFRLVTKLPFLQSFQQNASSFLKPSAKRL